MCGFWCSISKARPVMPSHEAVRLIQARGPDGSSTVQIRLDVGPKGEEWWMVVCASVLALRKPGGRAVIQPIVGAGASLHDDPGNRTAIVDGNVSSVLCWNGEIWQFDGRDLGPDESDTLFLFDQLEGAASASHAQEVLDLVTGPFALFYYSKAQKRVVFGRDRIGRRSLVMRYWDECVVISSVAADPLDGECSGPTDWTEVAADGLYAIQVGENDPTGLTRSTPGGLITGFAFTHPDTEGERVVGPFEPISLAAPAGKGDDGGEWKLTARSTAVANLSRLLEESVRRRVEGQAKSVAVLFSGGIDCSVIARLADQVLPPDVEIELVNVAFENPRVVSAAAAAGRRNQDGRDGRRNQDGRDDRYDGDVYMLCPDRVTGLAGAAELAALGPARRWKVVLVDVAYSVFCAHRDEIRRLIWPHRSEMDISIAAAFYFGARGQGRLAGCPDRTDYRACSPVFLSGLGADELFGGYRRHELASDRGGNAGLAAELHLDFSSLGARNLGRDDRVVAHWGREIRYPFLDEHLVSYALELPVALKCPFGSVDKDDDIEPGKKIARLVGLNVGLVGAARQKKRAVQFGARTAKMEIGSGRLRGTAVIE